MLIHTHVLASWLLQLRTWLARTKSMSKPYGALFHSGQGSNDSFFVCVKLFGVLPFAAGILLRLMDGVLGVNSVGLC